MFAGRLLYIAGSGRCGSTLLDLLLNNHPLVQSLGEVHRLCLYARTRAETCTCGADVLDCPFWSSIEAEIHRIVDAPSRGRPLETFDLMIGPHEGRAVQDALERLMLVASGPAVFRRWAQVFSVKNWSAARASFAWYEAACRVSGAEVVVDSSKDPRRLKFLYQHSPDAVRVVHLVRDGRAVVASTMRHLGIDVAQASERWVRLNRRLALALWRIPQEARMRLRYEDLCQNPDEALSGVCRFVNLSYDPEMRNLRKESAHNIGGNPMRFRKEEIEIAADERWRAQLSEDDLAVFERIAGPWNRRFGYQ